MNIDKIKETLNTLRVVLSISSVFIITLGGALGSMIKIIQVIIFFGYHFGYLNSFYYLR